MIVRRLRGLRAQLLLWTILPLAAVLVVLSLAGILRHRQAMTQLVEERDQGLALAEAGRLGREVERRIDLLARAATAPELRRETPPDAATIANLSAGLAESYAGGLVLLASDGTVLAASPQAATWAGSPIARALTMQTLAAGQPQSAEYAGDDPASFSLFVAVPVPGERVLLGAFPLETLNLVESGLLLQTETHGAVFVLDRNGRPLHRSTPGGGSSNIASLEIGLSALAHLPPIPAKGVGATHLRAAGGKELLITYAQVEPPGWTLVIAEDLNAINAMGISVVEALPMVLLFVAVIALLAVSFGVATIVRPLQELAQRASRVAWGDFEAIGTPVGGVQEMEDLRATLEQMAVRIRSYQAGMRDYLSAVTQAQEAERARLAHELHDDTVQALIALGQRVQMARKALNQDPARAAQRLDELNGLIDQQLVGLRRLISDLRPIYLEDLGFVPALEMLAKRIGERHHLTVKLEVQGEMVRLTPDLELAAFRIVQEALNNAATHAQAHTVNLTVTFAADSLTLTIQDDGRGFTPPDQPADLARQGHYGLMGMRERALLYGGYLTITSAPGHGTTITAWLPMR